MLKKFNYCNLEYFDNKYFQVCYINNLFSIIKFDYKNRFYEKNK